MTVVQQQIGNLSGVAACSVGDAGQNRSNINGTTGGQDAGLDMDNADTIATMDSRLNTIDSGFYTTAKLAGLTYNDKLYAIRLNDYANTIKQ